jgi:hypothetical protein
MLIKIWNSGGLISDKFLICTQVPTSQNEISAWYFMFKNSQNIAPPYLLHLTADTKEPVCLYIILRKNIFPSSHLKLYTESFTTSVLPVSYL